MALKVARGYFSDEGAVRLPFYACSHAAGRQRFSTQVSGPYLVPRGQDVVDGCMFRTCASLPPQGPCCTWNLVDLPGRGASRSGLIDVCWRGASS